MQLSIIVPVYNMAAGGKLQFCLDSLLNQAITDYEILAVDDASTDDSLAVLKEYEARYPDRIRVCHYPDNRRQGGAKNVGLAEAVGDWIGFVDSDDWVAPDCYAKLLAKAEETGADLVGCHYSLVTEHTFTVGGIVQNNTLEQTGVLHEEGHKRLFICPGSMVIKIYRRAVITENHLHFPEKIFYEDNCAGSLWSTYFHHFELVDEPLYYYYQHAVSTVHHVSVDKCRDRMTAMELLIEELSDRGRLEEYRTEAEYRFAELYLVNTLFSYMQGVRNPGISFVVEMRRGIERYFPGFMENPYYRERTGEEEKRLIALLMKSPVGFYLLYRAKLFVRRLKG